MSVTGFDMVFDVFSEYFMCISSVKSGINRYVDHSCNEHLFFHEKCGLEEIEHKMKFLNPWWLIISSDHMPV